jgi:hypothetical protein
LGARQGRDIRHVSLGEAHPGGIAVDREGNAYVVTVAANKPRMMPTLGRRLPSGSNTRSVPSRSGVQQQEYGLVRHQYGERHHCQDTGDRLDARARHA